MYECIVVYSESDAFRCASDPYRLDYQCLLKLASVIIDEVWHDKGTVRRKRVCTR